MGWKAFLASVIDSLAWPATIAFIVYLLREPLRSVIRGLRKVRYRDLQAEFGDYVQEAGIAAQALPSPEPDTGEPALSTELAPEISTAPRAAVIEAWLAVEQELEALAEVSGIAPRPMRTGWLVTVLQEQGVIDKSLAAVLRDLKGARDVAAHVRPYTVERAAVVDYVKLAGRVRDALRQQKERMPKDGVSGQGQRG